MNTTTEAPARTTLPVLPEIASRFSPRAFSDTPLEGHVLELVLEAARLAPSSMNEQPWRFLVTRRGEEPHDRLVSTLMDGNRPWADRAPVLMLCMVRTHFTRNGAPNVHARHDLGLAIGQLSVQATALGLGLHQLGGFHADHARKAFQVPEAFDLVSVIALGYPGDPSELPEHLRQRELVRSPRKPLHEVVWDGSVPDQGAF